MNHVILLLRPLKMKDWLLYGIKNVAATKWIRHQNPAAATGDKDGGCLGGLSSDQPEEGRVSNTLR